MDRGLGRAIQRIEASDTVDAIWDLLLEALHPHRISHVIYITVASKAPVNPVVLSNMPPDWAAAFQNKTDVFDPFLEYCCSTYDITLTGVEFLDTYPYLDDKAKDFIRAAAEIGFLSGLGIPIRLMGAERYGGFNLGTGLKRAEFEAEVLPVSEMLRAFCLIAHRRIEEVTQNAATAMRVKSLSSREKQCLTLLAGGLAVSKIAEHLGLSEAAIWLYLKNAKTKLGAQTSEEMIALAMAHGLLDQ